MSPHVDPDCHMCSDLRAVISDLDAAIAKPRTHLRFAGYRKVLIERLTLHATVRHAPESSSIPMREGEAEALDREERGTIALTGEIERIVRRFTAENDPANDVSEEHDNV